MMEKNTNVEQILTFKTAVLAVYQWINRAMLMAGLYKHINWCKINNNMFSVEDKDAIKDISNGKNILCSSNWN